MKKAWEFILLNKYKVATILLLVLCFFQYRQGLIKEHTYEMTLMKNDLREEKNKEMQQLRSALNESIADRKVSMRANEIGDSLVKANTLVLDRQLYLLQTQSNNRYERNKVIDTYGSDELRNAYSGLPKYNEYSR